MEQKRDGTLMIAVVRGKKATHSAFGPPVRESRFSVHYGTISPEYSTLKRHFRAGDDPDATSVAMTKALKTPGRFSTLFVYLYPDLRNERYAADPSSRVQSANVVSAPGACTLAMAMLVGSVETVFPESPDPTEFAMMQVVIGPITGRMDQRHTRQRDDHPTTSRRKPMRRRRVCAIPKRHLP